MSPLSLQRRASRGALAALLFAVGGGSLVIGASAASATEQLPTVPLHNATAQGGEDCPSGGGAWWHFILAPNSGGSSFEAITLNLGTETVVATGAAIVPNGNQTDNVFVAVPSGHQLDDLELDGSFAAYSGTTPTKFNLSHVCEGSSQPPVTEPPVTEPPDTDDTITEPPVTEPPVTQPPRTDGTSTPATVLGATVDSVDTIDTVAPGVEPTAATPVSTSGTLPYTGSDDTPFVVAGLACLGGGLLLASAARAKLARSNAER